MGSFVSKREKKYWILASLVVISILSTTIFLERPLQKVFVNHDFQVGVFLFGMLLTATTIGYYGLFHKVNKYEIVIWIGMAAITTMFLFRLGVSERSHIMEFSVLAIFIHLALSERYRNTSTDMKIMIFSFFLTVFFGLIDEGIQFFLPDRVFDLDDIYFNLIAAAMAIGGMGIFRWLRRQFKTFT